MLDLLLPRACVACAALLGGQERGIVCGLCWSRIISLPSPACTRCGHPLAGNGCSWCANLPPFVRAVRSCCWYPGGSAATIVAALKYGGWRIVAEEMAERMSRIAWPRDVFEEQPLVVPVPLASQRERERGYNQSAELARSLGLRWKVEVMIDSLVRNRATETQTRLAPEERSRNVAGAFSLAPGVKRAARGKHIMLVDDVVTTASTLNECASVLFASGARIVSYCTFGRARAAADLT